MFGRLLLTLLTDLLRAADGYTWIGSNCLLAVYLGSELILIDTKSSISQVSLADVPGSAYETPPPRYVPG
jgi:hypothetical protein